MDISKFSESFQEAFTKFAKNYQTHSFSTKFLSFDGSICSICKFNYSLGMGWNIPTCNEYIMENIIK